MSKRNLVGSPEWLERQTTQFSRIAPALASYATELRRILQSAAVDLGPLAIVQVRTKSPASFAQKALKKQREHDCPTHQFTDLCGGRVIVRTRREVEAISRSVESSFDIDWANSVDASAALIQPSSATAPSTTSSLAIERTTAMTYPTRCSGLSVASVGSAIR